MRHASFMSEAFAETRVSDSAATFAATMPAAYRASFDEAAVAAHAAIASRRGASASHVETWKSFGDGGIVLCVVALDEPGLFARISASLAARGIDIVSADAYCRTRDDGTAEAVDILHVRSVPTSNGLAPIDVPSIGADIEAFLQGDLGLETPLSVQVPAGGGFGTRVRFDKASGSHATVLTVETVDRPGLLLVLTKTLFRAGLSIVGLRAKTEGGEVMDRFELVDGDGAALGPARRLELQVLILEAIEAARGLRTSV